MLLALIAVINLICAAVQWGFFLEAPSISGLLWALTSTVAFFYVVWVCTDGR